ncbi:MAG: hypothetical protein Q8O94_02760 [bacterium]|nr:hypothetical protein [bacterium]
MTPTNQQQQQQYQNPYWRTPGAPPNPAEMQNGFEKWLDEHGQDLIANAIERQKKVRGLIPNIELGFIYSPVTNPIVVAANGSAQTSIYITPDADFLVSQICATSNAPFLYQVTDAGASRTWFSQFQNSVNATGLAQRPFFLPSPIMALQQTTLTINITNLSVNQQNTIYLSFQGAKLFAGKQSR